jgi:hypothetical protein
VVTKGSFDLWYENVYELEVEAAENLPAQPVYVEDSECVRSKAQRKCRDGLDSLLVQGGMRRDEIARHLTLTCADRHVTEPAVSRRL